MKKDEVIQLLRLLSKSKNQILMHNTTASAEPASESDKSAAKARENKAQTKSKCQLDSIRDKLTAERSNQKMVNLNSFGTSDQKASSLEQLSQ